MSAGAMVFPLAILAAFGLIVSFVASHPAQPLPGDPSQRFLKVEPGDELVLEVTGYYGDQGFVFVSTQEERVQSGELKSREGPVAPQYQLPGVPYTVNGRATPASGGLDGALLGHKINATFTTPKFEPGLAFGRWEGVREFNRTLDPYPLSNTFNRTTETGFGGAFNLTQYLAYWARNGYSELTVGSIFPCEGPERWPCKVVRIDASDDAITYRRDVANGQTWPITIGLEGAGAIPGIQGDAVVRVDEARGEFTLTWRPVDGDLFQLRQDVPGFLPSGTFHVQGTRGDKVLAEYSSNTRAPPHLVGQLVWYDVVVTQISRGTAPA